MKPILWNQSSAFEYGDDKREIGISTHTVCRSYQKSNYFFSCRSGRSDRTATPARHISLSAISLSSFSRLIR